MTTMADAPAELTDSVEASSLSASACLFRGLADPSRLLILRHLLTGEHRVVDLTQHLGLAQSTVSQHLACLRDCGLVTSRAEGRASWFALAHPQAVLDVLGAAERLLGLTGDAAEACATTRRADARTSRGGRRG